MSVTTGQQSLVGELGCYKLSELIEGKLRVSFIPSYWLNVHITYMFVVEKVIQNDKAYNKLPFGFLFDGLHRALPFSDPSVVYKSQFKRTKK